MTNRLIDCGTCGCRQLASSFEREGCWACTRQAEEQKEEQEFQEFMEMDEEDRWRELWSRV